MGASFQRLPRIGCPELIRTKRTALRVGHHSHPSGRIFMRPRSVFNRWWLQIEGSDDKNGHVTYVITNIYVVG